VLHAYNPSYSGGLWFKASLGKQFVRPHLKKSYHKKIGLVDWLKVKALSSSPSTSKKKIIMY
jgi:hypothetical protein